MKISLKILEGSMIFLLATILITVIITSTKQKDKLIEENQILYGYVDNFDKYKTLDEAREGRDDVLEEIQFLYE